jgi:hypothetical protein
MDNQEIARAFADGTPKTADPRVIAYEKSLREQIKESGKKLKNQQVNTEEDNRKLSDYLGRQLDTVFKEFLEAKYKWRNRSDATARKIDQGVTLTAPYQRESQQIQADYNVIMRRP